MEYSIQKLGNTHSSQWQMEPSLKLIALQATKQAFTKKMEIIPGILSDHSEIKLETHGHRNPGNYIHTWRVNIIVLNEWQITEEIRGENTSIPDQNDAQLLRTCRIQPRLYK